MAHPECLCDKHLLSEHNELHRLAKAVAHGHDLQDYLDGGQVAPQYARAHHKAVADELCRRGFAHGSPLVMYVGPRVPRGRVDANTSARVLAKQCANCRKRMEREMMREIAGLKMTFAARVRASTLWGDPIFKGSGARAMQQVSRCVAEVSWNMTHTAGRAWRKSAQHDGKPLIKLSGPLLIERWEQLEETVLHELAHVFTMHAQAQAKPHGRLWKSVARAAGCQPKACHNMHPARDNTVRGASCGCRNWRLGRTRAKRMISGRRTYWCRNCGQTLKLDEGAHD